MDAFPRHISLLTHLPFEGVKKVRRFKGELPKPHGMPWGFACNQKNILTIVFLMLL
jgi:hypothetical protein